MRTSSAQQADKPLGHRYWNEQGKRFKRSFFGAQSTKFYLAEEQRIFNKGFGGLENRRLLKLDAWSEAQNTEVLFWAARQGAECFAVDIAESTAFKARDRSRDLNVPICVAVADMLDLPFPDGTFDSLYTMGTIEHTPQQDRVLAEIARVLAKGGIAIIGVPNKMDPFLFYVGSSTMQLLNVYPYGYERWYTNGQLAARLKSHGLRIVHRDGMMFLPWFLRFLDIYFWIKIPWMARLTGIMVRPFRKLSLSSKFFRKFGYLTICIVKKS